MEKLEYKKYLRYAHLGPEDVRIWDKFIETHPDYFQMVAYDVKVGKGREYPESEMPEVKEDLVYLSKKRIDVVGFKGEDVFVIEIKPKANLSAVGQAFGLAELYRDEFGSGRRIVPVIITDEKIPDMEALCSRMGVLYLLCS